VPAVRELATAGRVEHVPATQTLQQRKPKSMRILYSGELGYGVRPPERRQSAPEAEAESGTTGITQREHARVPSGHDEPSGKVSNVFSLAKVLPQRSMRCPRGRRFTSRADDRAARLLPFDG